MNLKLKTQKTERLSLHEDKQVKHLNVLLQIKRTY